METTVRPTPALIFTTTLAPGPIDCIYNNEIYADGALVKKDIPCEHCYCMKGDIVCAVQECGPTPLDKVNCTALPIREGQCCPDTYDCENIIEEDLTTISYEYTTTPSVEPVEAEAATTVYPPATTSEALPTIAKEEVQVTERIQVSSVASEEPYTTTKSIEEVPSHDETAAAEEPEEEVTEEVAGATAKPIQVPIKEEQPKKEDQGFIPEATQAPEQVTTEKLASSPQPETEQPDVVTVQPAVEAETEKLPSSEQVTEASTSKAAEEQTTLAATTADVSSVTGKEGEQESETVAPSENEKTEAPIEKVTVQPQEQLKEKEQTPTERPSSEAPAPTTSVPKEEQYTTTEVSSTASEAEKEKPTEAEQATEENILPTIQPSELEKEGVTVTEREFTQTTETAVQLTTVPEEIKTTAAELPAKTERIPEKELEAQTPAIIETTQYPSEVATTEAGVTVGVTEQKPKEEIVQKEQTTVFVTERVYEKATESVVTTSGPLAETTEQVRQEPAAEQPSATSKDELLTTEQPATTEATKAETEGQATTAALLPAATGKPEELPAAMEEIVTEQPATELPYAAHDEVAGEEEEEEEEEKEGSGTQLPELLSEKPVDIEKPTETIPEATTEPARVTETSSESVTERVDKYTESSSQSATTEAQFEATTSEENETAVTEKELAVPEKVTELATAESIKPSTQVSPTEKMPSAETETTTAATEREAETTEAISEATTPSPSEVTEQPIKKEEAATETRIPGEGSCLVDGQTYTNNSVVPPINHCQTSCKCVSSILQCESITCTAAPANLQNCMPVYEGPDSCCPTYSCCKYNICGSYILLSLSAIYLYFQPHLTHLKWNLTVTSYKRPLPHLQNSLQLL